MIPKAADNSGAGRAGWPALDHIDTQVAVGVTVVRALKNDPMRFGVMFQNVGAGNITVSLNDNAAAGEGILLAAGSAPVFLDNDRLAGVAGRAWYAICSAAGGSLEVIYVRAIQG